LSADAVAIHNQVHAILRDENLTPKQACEKINEIAAKASDSIKSELPRLKVRNCNGPFDGRASRSFGVRGNRFFS
jgi:hypothetical protein